MAIVDQYGREIRSGKPILDEIAVQTVRTRYSSYPSQGLTPERLAAILKEADQGYIVRQAELFEEMEEKDCHLASVIQTRKFAVAGLPYEVLPASRSDEDERIARFCSEALEYVGTFDAMDDGVHGALLDMLDAIAKGFSVLELIYEISGVQVWLKRLEFVPQKRFTFSGPPQTINGQMISPLLNQPRLLTDDEPVWGEELPPHKFVFFRHKARSGSASRGGLLRPSAYMYLFKNYAVKDWLIFNELYSVPMRIGKYKPGATKDEIEKLKQAVFNLGVDAAAVISDATVIEIIEAAARGNTDSLSALPDYCDRAMSKVWLGHTAAAESTPGKLGSETLASDVRHDLLESDAKALERLVRNQILAPLVLYNFGPDKSVPLFRLYYEAEEDIEKSARVYTALVRDIGFDQIPVSHIQQKFGIPVPRSGEATLKPPAATYGITGEPEQTLHKRCACGAMLHRTRVTPAQQQVDKFVDATVEASAHALAGNEAAIKAAISQATSWDDAIERILTLYPALDMDRLRDIMESAVFQAEAFGRLTVSKEL